MELIREWLLGVTGVAFLLALAEGLMPEGTAQKVGKLVGGLLLFLAMFRPLAGFDYEGLVSQIEDCDWDVTTSYETLKMENQKLTGAIIAEELGAYIEEKAAALGADCVAEVTCRKDENDLQVPDSVRLTGNFPRETQTELGAFIREELDIPVERQVYVQEGSE